MEFASRATLAATALIVLTLLLHRLESPRPPPLPSYTCYSSNPPECFLAPPVRTEPTPLQQQPAALPSAGNGTAIQFWHVTDWHLNLFHRADGDVRDMCRSATSDRAHWPGPYATEASNPGRASAKQVSYLHVRALPWTGSATSTAIRRGPCPRWQCAGWRRRSLRPPSCCWAATTSATCPPPPRTRRPSEPVTSPWRMPDQGSNPDLQVAG